MSASLRQSLVFWLNTKVRYPQARSRCIKSFDESEAAQTDCRFVIGEDLSTANQAYLVHCFAGELFAFDLTPPQRQRLGVVANQLRHVTEPRTRPSRADRPAVVLGPLELIDEAELGRAGQITVRCQYSAPWEPGWNHNPLCAVRFGHVTQTSTVTNWRYLDAPLDPTGLVELRFPEESLFGADVPRPLALFARAVAVHHPQTHEDDLAISDTRATLVG